jgi:hypothetical protein
MDDWVKIAKELQLKDELRAYKSKTRAKGGVEKSLASEEDWMERVAARVMQIAAEGIRIRIEPKPKGMQLICRGTVDIELLENENFAIKYHHVVKPSNILISRPVRIYHHRLVRVRMLNAHNIEEILKYVALGMEEYTEVAARQRLEHNLEGLIKSVNLDDHVEGPFPRDQ